jgi:hypothetical protein
MYLMFTGSFVGISLGAIKELSASAKRLSCTKHRYSWKNKGLSFCKGIKDSDEPTVQPRPVE